MSRMVTTGAIVALLAFLVGTLLSHSRYFYSAIRFTLMWKQFVDICNILHKQNRSAKETPLNAKPCNTSYQSNYISLFLKLYFLIQKVRKYQQKRVQNMLNIQNITDRSLKRKKDVHTILLILLSMKQKHHHNNYTCLILIDIMQENLK